MTSRKPTRVLYCETNVDGTIGGSYYSLLYLIKGLDKSRFSPFVVFYVNHGLLPAFEAAGARTIVWPKSRRFAFVERLPRTLLWARPMVLAVQRALNLFQGFVSPTIARVFFLTRHRIDLVHLNNSILYNHDWMAAARLTGRRCVCHERGINEFYPPAAKYWGRHLDAIVCISEAVRNAMAAADADFGNLITIPNGFDPAEMLVAVPPAELRRRLHISDAAGVVVMVGNLKAWKGQETVIRAIEVVKRAHPSVRCVLVGATAPADRAFEDEMRGLVADLGLADSIIFAGFHRNVADLLMMGDVIVHASVRPEPFGRVLLEAMACRKPIIGSRAGGVPEIIEHGRTGLMFPPGDYQALADAILGLLANREEADRMGQNGYQRLLDRFHIALNIEATVQVYERSLARTA
jgi:glycosyltransferase involved in cell wall biosynthesis